MEKSLEILLEEKKNRITEKLSSQYSLSRISLDEYERLIEYSQKIETEKELRILEKIVDENNAPEMKYQKTTIPDYVEKDHYTVLSSKKTTGPVTSGTITNILGDHKFYIDEDDLIEDETVFEMSVLLGSVIFYVPDNVSIINKAIPILSDIKINNNLKNKGYGKRIVIRGSVILGDIKFKPR